LPVGRENRYWDLPSLVRSQISARYMAYFLLLLEFDLCEGGSLLWQMASAKISKSYNRILHPGLMGNGHITFLCIARSRWMANENIPPSKTFRLRRFMFPQLVYNRHTAWFLTTSILGSRVRIPLKESSSLFCVVLSCVGRGLATGRSPVQGNLNWRPNP
jgi:hypothetical protein